MRKINLKIMLIITVMFFSLNVINANAQKINNNQKKIISAGNLNYTISANEKFAFPKETKAITSDKKTIVVQVNWNSTTVKTEVPGVYYYYGTIKGYSGKISLKLVIKAPPIVIKTIDDITAEIKHNEKYSLPDLVDAEMSDNSNQKVMVSWDAKDVSTAVDGNYEFHGKVKGYDKTIKLTLNVTPIISSAADVTKVVKLNENVEFPDAVTVKMSNDTTTEAAVIWDNPSFEKKPGTYIFDGSVDGYSGKVKYIVTIEKLTIQDIAKENSKVLMLNIFDKDNKIIATGSGFIISKDGRIVTNFHVIDKADHIKAVAADNKTYDIDYVVNYDKNRDFAVLRIKSQDVFTPVIIGDSDKLEMGQDVIAIGSPLGLQNTVSSGIVSSIRKSTRNADDAKDIQVSAPISPGSSGGALFNMAGEVVGITYAGIVDGQNLNFAIPINELTTLSKDKNLSLAEIYDKEHVLSYLDGSKYEGDLLNGKREGSGIMTWADGDKYVGNYKADKESGYGVFYWQSGAKYSGYWSDGIMDDYGEFVQKDGTKYAGDYRNGKEQGIGVLTYTNGDVYKGEFYNNMESGVGTYIYANGEKYTGEWTNNTFDGIGFYVKSDKSIVAGIWKDGKFLNNDVKDSTDPIKCFDEIAKVPAVQDEKYIKTEYTSDKRYVKYCYNKDIDLVKYSKLLVSYGYYYIDTDVSNDEADTLCFENENSQFVYIYTTDDFIVISGKL